MTINDNTTEPTTRRAGSTCLREGLDELVNSLNLEISLLQHAVEKSAEWDGSVLPGEIALQHTVFARDAILRVLEDSDSENAPCCATGTEGKPVATDVIPAQKVREFLADWGSFDTLDGEDAEGILEDLRDLLPTQPTMADIEWDDDVHAGLEAEHITRGRVRMIYRGDGVFIMVIDTEGVSLLADPSELTPIPGTKIDLTPRRESTSNIDGSSDGPGTINDEAPIINVASPPRPEDVPVGEVWEVECALAGTWVGVRLASREESPWSLVRTDARSNFYPDDSSVTLVRRLVPEAMHGHPTFLDSLEDYESAPVGTVVAYAGDVAVKRDNGRWQWTGQSGTFWSDDFDDGDPCTVVRWGK